MASVNKATIVGNLAKDPESRAVGETRVVNMTVVTNDIWTDRDTGERKERPEFHRVVIWNDRIGEVATKYLRKGSQVYIEGALQTRKYTDQSGQEKYTTEIVLQRFRGELQLLDRRGSGAEPGESTPSPVGRSAPRPRADPGPGPSMADTSIDDEIPF